MIIESALLASAAATALEGAAAAGTAAECATAVESAAVAGTAAEGVAIAEGATAVGAAAEGAAVAGTAAEGVAIAGGAAECAAIAEGATAVGGATLEGANIAASAAEIAALARGAAVAANTVAEIAAASGLPQVAALAKTTATLASSVSELATIVSGTATVGTAIESAVEGAAVAGTAEGVTAAGSAAEGAAMAQGMAAAAEGTAEGKAIAEAAHAATISSEIPAAIEKAAAIENIPHNLEKATKVLEPNMREIQELPLDAIEHTNMENSAANIDGVSPNSLKLTEEQKQILIEKHNFPENLLDDMRVNENNEYSITCINERYKNMENPDTGIPYVEKTITINGVDNIKVVVPEFPSFFDVDVPHELWESGDASMFKHCTEQLKEAINEDAALKGSFNPEQLSSIERGMPRIPGMTWHHTETPGKVQLVDSKTHFDTRHTGGDFLWCGGIR